MPYLDSPEARYMRDPAFKTLVDMMQALIQRADYSPSEVREGAMLACIHHEAVTIRHRVIYVDAAGFAADVL